MSVDWLKLNLNLEKCRRRPNSRAQQNYWTKTDQLKTHGIQCLGRFLRLWTHLLLKFLISILRSKKLIQRKKGHASNGQVRKMINSLNSINNSQKNGTRSLRISQINQNCRYVAVGLQNTIQTTNIVAGLQMKIESL